jgi:hypothetical protein
MKAEDAVYEAFQECSIDIQARMVALITDAEREAFAAGRAGRNEWITLRDLVRWPTYDDWQKERRND